MFVATRGTGGMPDRASLLGINIVTGVSMCAVKDSVGKELLARDARWVGRRSDLTAMLTHDVCVVSCLRGQGL